jgi:hypothetical protein
LSETAVIERKLVVVVHIVSQSVHADLVLLHSELGVQPIVGSDDRLNHFVAVRLAVPTVAPDPCRRIVRRVKPVDHQRRAVCTAADPKLNVIKRKRFRVV